MSKLVRIEYQVTSRAYHWVEVPDWFDVDKPEHCVLLEENEMLQCESYQHEEVVDFHVEGVYNAPNELGGMDFTDLYFTDLEQP